MRIRLFLLCLTGLAHIAAAQQPAESTTGGTTQAEKPTETAATPAPSSRFSYKGFDISGNVDTYYSLNFNRPDSAANQLRNFDTQANRPALSMARLSVERQTGMFGFRVDVGTGRGYNVFHATEVDLGNGVWRHIPQAYVSFRPFKGRAVQIDAGKFYTSAGAELTDTHLNWNYSRSLLFANGPYYHMGVRTSVPVTSKWTTGFQLVNGWNNLKDLNDGKTFGFTNSYAFNKKVSIFNTVYVGPEKIGTTEGWRQFVDTVVNFTPSDKIAFYLNYDYGTEKAFGGGSRNQFQGLAGAFRYQLASKWAVAARAEWYGDRDGFITGQSQNLNEFTTTLEYRPIDYTVLRLEYRRDGSDQPFFDRRSDGAARRSMNTLLAGLVIYWAPKK